MGIYGKQVDKNSMRRAVSVILGVVLNVIPAFLVHLLEVPLYLDTTGTIMVAALGGTLPGIITALLCNLICSFFNHQAIYYVLINILIAIVTSFFVRYDKFKRKINMVFYFVWLALLGGVLGAVFQWLLLGGPQLSEVSRAALALSEESGMGVFPASVLVNVGLNFVDKFISGALAFIVVHYIPQEIRKSIWNSGWKQKPPTPEQMKEYAYERKSRGISLGRRMTGLLVVASVVMSGVMAVVGLSLYSRKLEGEYQDKAVNAAHFVALNLDGDLITEYHKSAANYAEYADPGYRRTDALIEEYRKSVNGISDIFVVHVLDDKYYTVFVSDPEQKAGAYIGEENELVTELSGKLPELSEGKSVDTQIDLKEHGKTRIAFEPVFDSAGRLTAYVVVGTVLDFMQDYLQKFLVQMLLVFLGFLVMIIAFGLWVTGHDLIYPVKGLASNARGFIRDNSDQRELDQNVKKLRELDIHTGDEIEDLYQSICKMASDMAEQMREIRHYADSTAQMQSGLLITMADLVESRDSDTGAHIQKTAAYVKIIADGLKRKGYYVEKLTPKFMKDVEMSAPLHDVGKINIPDAVLNKPGKLTAEEYDIMKTHTTIGRMIIEKAISTVRGDSYLKEARNMAGYHHERWDGKGYPEGLHGEVIPLSARIMAVADVFDALTSARVYKPAFPLEEALKMIQEGAGTQFDPKCVEVFMDSLPEVKKVLKKYNQL